MRIPVSERVVILNIIIVGAGKVGYALAEQLSREDHNLTIIDSSEAAVRRVCDTLDVIGILGNGVTVPVLEAAGAAQADLLIAASGQDEANMVCCLTAKNMGTKYTIARIRSPEYFESIGRIKRDMGIGMVINPDRATAREIARLLRFPSAANIESFCRGRVELMGFRVQEGDFLVGKPLHAQADKLKKLSMLLCAAERGDELIIPNGSFVPQVDDTLYAIGEPAALDQFFHTLGRYTQKSKSVFVVGGSRIAIYLAKLLDKMRVKVKIVEQNESLCRTISELLPQTTVICGDGTDQEVLESENMAASDAFIALTNRDEYNLLVSLYAAQQGVDKVIAKCNRQNYASIARSCGLDSVISPRQITANYILHVVRGMQNSQGSVMHALYRIANDKAEALEFAVNKSTENLGIALKDLVLKRGILIAVIVRGEQVIIPDGSSWLQEGDSVIIVTREHTILNLNDIYDAAGTVGG